MKQTKLDDLCRIVIPASMRKNLGMEKGTLLEIRQVNDYIIIKSVQNTCRLCGAHTVANNELMICNTCIEKIKKI